MSRVLVDIGVGAEPQSSYGLNYPFEPGDIYIPVELPVTVSASGFYMSRGRGVPCELSASDNFLLLHPEQRDVIFAPLFASGEELPLPDNSVDEATMSNVLGDPGISGPTKLNILREAVRVTKAEGTVTVIETYTPTYALGFMLGTTKHLEDLLSIKNHRKVGPKLDEEYFAISGGEPGDIYQFFPIKSAA